MNRKVLIFSYRFPPFGGSGAVRFTSITKYLSSYGWEPFVFTVDWNQKNCRKFDPNFGSSTKDAVIHRAKNRPSTQASFKNDPANHVVAKLVRKIDRSRRLFLELRNRSNWIKEGKQVLGNLIKQHNGFDAAIATYPIAAAMALGDWTSRNFNFPWIADFRDIVEESHSSSLSYAKHVERKRLVSSSAITTVSEPLAEVLRGRHSQPVHCIPNGFDPADISSVDKAPSSPQKQFQILYTGQLYPPGHPTRESPAILFEALDKLDSENEIDLSDFEIVLVGTPKQKLFPHLNGRKSEKRLKIVEWVAKSEIFAMQKQATVLLSLGSREIQGILTGKIFEYMQTRRPIISIPKDDAGIGKILEETHSGTALEELPEIASHIKRLYREWKPTRSLPPNPECEELNQYNWRNQTGRFAEILNQISSV